MRGPLLQTGHACGFSDALKVIATLRTFKYVATEPMPRWVDATQRVVFYIDVDAIDDQGDLACIELEIKRACEQAVGLHAAVAAKPALRRTSSSMTMRAVRIGEEKP